MGLLYHYTSLEAFKKIVESNSIRLTHISFLNDGNEMRHGKSLIKSILQSRGWDEKHISRFERQFSEHCGAGSETYVFCTTKLHDAFTQWKLYGADGRGVAIGFDDQKLGCLPDTRLSKVVYSESKQLQLLEDQLAGLTTSSSSIELMMTVHGYIEQLISTFKQAEFSTEDESRLVARVIDLEDSRLSLDGTLSGIESSFEDIEFDTRDGFLVPFVVRELQDLRPLTRVVLGPRTSTISNVASVKRWLRNADMEEVEVITSNIRMQG